MRKWITLKTDTIYDLEWRLTSIASDYDHTLILTDKYKEASRLYNSMSRYKILAGFGALDTFCCSVNDLESSVKHNDWYLGFFSYDLKRDLFNIPDSTKNTTIYFPPLFFFRPRYIIRSDGYSIVLGYDTDYDDETNAGKFIEKIEALSVINNHLSVSNVSIKQCVIKEDYIKSVESIKKHIARGDIYEINYCIEFITEGVSEIPELLFSKMMDISPMPFSAFLKNDEHYVLCASPERYLKKEGNKVFSMPMKGTSKRLNHDLFDTEGYSVLKNSGKEHSENIMITDLVRNDLSRFAKPGSVNVDELCGIYPFPGVYQMVSTVSCELKNGITWAEPIRCSFPMGSMTGAPKQRAIELIDIFEKGSRGLYSGAIGYITPDKDFDFNVVIRSLLLNKNNKKGSFSVGSAITSESKAEDEYNECLLKAEAIIKILNNR